MKQNSINKILVILFILIVSYSIYNDKLKNNKKVDKEEKVINNNDYILIEDNIFYKLYKNDDNYKYIIYSKDKEIIAEEVVDRYTYINKHNNYIEVKINYGSKNILSKIYSIDKKQLLLEKSNVYLFNDKYVVIINDDIEIQDINSKDNYYKKEKLDYVVINNILDIKFTDKDKKILIIYLEGKEEKKYSIKL